MTEFEKLTIMKERYKKLKESPKNEKCGGCIRKLKRKIAKMEMNYDTMLG